MTFSSDPHVSVQRQGIPILYLDTCIVLELAKQATGKCTNTHQKEISELFILLPELMSAGKLLCPLGNQLIEMGMSRGRKNAKEFLLHFTNACFKLPNEIKEAELAIGYQAFTKQIPRIEIDPTLVLDEELMTDSRFYIHLAPVYSPENLAERKNVKQSIVDAVNAVKATGLTKEDWNAQLRRELLADYQLAWFAFVPQEGYTPSTAHVLHQLELVYSRTGLCQRAGAPIPGDIADLYCRFLQSSYHHNLPFQRIEAVLWAHFMYRSNKIVSGDRLDALWAAAYFPFVDYAITDHSFCTLLNESGLSSLYNTKVYSMRSLREIIDLLQTLKDD